MRDLEPVAARSEPPEPGIERATVRPYVGRLAPSPTGPAHLGIAQTALVAWLDARAHDGRLLLRIEDVDTPRVVPGAETDLLRDLAWLGLDWDGPVLRQSARGAAYRDALARLDALGRVFSCTCSRKEIRAASAPHGPREDGPRYPGTCRGGARPRPDRTPAIRFRTRPEDRTVHVDRRLGRLEQDVDAAVGDFVLRRADGLWAYQLAVTVDDLAQGVSCVVRGADLLGSTPRQLTLRRALDPEAPPLETLHTPLVLGPDGRRLAKRDGATAIAARRAVGEPPEHLVGEMAAALGLLPAPEPIAARDLVAPWRARLVPQARAAST